jgi:ABC-type lipoprotein release transport system permease subunit
MPATIVLTLALAGGIACWVPARRALGIKPAEALSAD